MPARLLPLSVVCLLAGAADVAAAEDGAQVELTGIVHFNGQSRALLEISGGVLKSRSVKPILSAGESIARVQVREIDPRAGQVRIANAGEESVLSLDDKPAATQRTFHFKSADVLQLLEIYQELAGRTILRVANLPASKHTARTESLSSGDALRFLEGELLAKGILLDPRGEKFFLAVRSGQLEPLSLVTDPPPTEASSVKSPAGAEVIPAGMIKFGEADPFQVLEIYQELTGRTVLRSSNLRGGKVSVRSQTPLSREEAAWMLDAALALADVRTVPQGEKFAFALPAVSNGIAPAVEANPRLQTSRDLEPLPAGAIKFSSAEGRQVLGVYARLVGRQPAEAPPPAARFDIRSQTELTPDEARFALDVLAAINHLRFVPVGDDQVALIPTGLTRLDAP